MSTPSTQYTDIKIIDCNRQHSIQANSGNEENTALFTNIRHSLLLDFTFFSSYSI